MANERNAGRKKKYAEKTVRVVRFYPPIAIAEIDKEASKVLKQYEVKKDK